MAFEYSNSFYKFSHAFGDPQNTPKVYKVEEDNGFLNVYADVILSDEGVEDLQYKVKVSIKKDETSIFGYKMISVTKEEN